MEKKRHIACTGNITCYFTGRIHYKTIDRGEIYYQVFLNEPDILAKGAYIILDTLCKECVSNTKIVDDATRVGLAPLTEGDHQCEAIRDSLYLKAKTDMSLITERLRPFQVSLIDTSFKLDKYGYTFYVKHIPTDSLLFCEIIMESNCIRTISMYQGNPQTFSQKPVIKLFNNIFKKEEEVDPAEFAEEVIPEHSDEK